MFKIVLALSLAAAASVPHKLPAKLDFSAVTIANQTVDHASFKGFDIYLVDDDVILSLAGQVVASGDASLLNGLPGGQQNATAGAHGCWLVPQAGGGLLLEDINTVCTGDTLGQAVAAYHAAVKEMESHGYEHMPASECD